MYEPGYDGGGMGAVAWLAILAIYCYFAYPTLSIRSLKRSAVPIRRGGHGSRS
jgi:hypothetical protein